MAAGMVLLASSTIGIKQDGYAKSADHLLIAATKKGAAVITDPIVTLETNKGAIRIQIYRKDAPITAGNFIDLVQKGFYNGLSFHRYEPGFLIQGGDPHGDGTGRYVDPQTRTERLVPLEIKQGLSHSDAGMVAMAHSGDPNSASCQFYITLAPATKLDGRYAVFGRVIDGMPVVMSLRKNDKIVYSEVKEYSGK